MNAGWVFSLLLCFLVITCNAQDEEYIWDYIIVGAGTAGAVLAKELSDNPALSVLVVEAGSRRDDDPRVKYASGYLGISQSAEFTFDIHSEAINTLGGVRRSLPQGRIWGGTSTTGAMYFIRGTRFDYDRWAHYGGEQWSADNVLPLFKELENNTLRNVDNMSEFLKHHGTEGPIPIENIDRVSQFYDVFRRAVKDVIGADDNSDFNGESIKGITRNVQIATTKLSPEVPYIRASSSSVFLSGDIVRVSAEGDGFGRHGRQLTIHSNSLATRLIFDQRVRTKVVGVEYIKNGRYRRAYARAEVILSAGAVNTPAILMRSGIGNCSELRELGINCVKDNANVGKNLQDHPAVIVTGQSKKVPIMLQHAHDPRYFPSMFAQVFYQSRQFDKYSDPRFGDAQVDSQMVMACFASNIVSDPITSTFTNNFDPVTGEMISHYMSLRIIMARPKCTAGRIALATKDPLMPPVVKVAYVCDEEGVDLEWMRENIRVGRSVFDKMAQLDSDFIVTGPSYDQLSDLKINKTVASSANTNFHLVGSARMGDERTQGGVVNGNLCAHGVQNLRVADASIMPFETTGNVLASVYMIGKKAATIVRTTTCS